jgi:hypothetical protein
MHLHTGLTPVEDGFPHGVFAETIDFPFDDQLTALADTSFNECFPMDQTFYNDSSLMPPRNSMVGLVDQELVAIPTIPDELSTYGQVVGLSQGLFSGEQFLPGKPLETLTAAADIPGEPFSLAAQTNDFVSQDGFDTGFSFGAGEFFLADLSQIQQQQYLSTMPMQQDALTGMYSTDMFSTSNNIDFTQFSGYGDDSLFLAQPLIPMYNDQLQVENKPRQESSFSSSSPPPVIEKKLAPTGQHKYYDERPARPADKPWVRVNATTQGKTSRTGKINHYDPEQYYSKIPHPLHSAWTSDSRGKEFRYNQWHELTKDCMPALVLKDFIYSHPKTQTCKLTLYIQRSPADSKRRYPTSTLDKCRFKECPMRVYGNKGSFLHGHYRVALDELSYKYGKGEHCDPFQVAGYVHLYCLERFLDLPSICRIPHVGVEADGRQLSKEPNGNFASALGGNEYRIALNFIQAARSSSGGQSGGEWSSYPSHHEYRDTDGTRQVQPKQHKFTLNYALQMCKNQGRGGRVMNRSKPSNIAVHRGDLEMYCLGRKGLLSEERITEILQELEENDNKGPTAQGKKRTAEDVADSANKRMRY